MKMLKLRDNKGQLFTRKKFILLIVSITTGFILGYSYHLSKERQTSTINAPYYAREDSYREELIDQQERNKELLEEANTLQDKIRQYEKSLAESEGKYESLVEQAEDLRLLLGEISGVGKGIRVTLKDGEYDPAKLNPNDYIVHESHIFKVMNELKISGAEAISINGQRVLANSYIKCNGPVITVDGKQYPAPFVIEAVGNPDVLLSAIKITGGVLDQLLNDNIIVTLEEEQKLTMSAIKVEN